MAQCLLYTASGEKESTRLFVNDSGAAAPQPSCSSAYEL